MLIDSLAWQHLMLRLFCRRCCCSVRPAVWGRIVLETDKHGTRWTVTHTMDVAILWEVFEFIGASPSGDHFQVLEMNHGTRVQWFHSLLEKLGCNLVYTHYRHFDDSENTVRGHCSFHLDSGDKSKSCSQCWWILCKFEFQDDHKTFVLRI